MITRYRLRCIAWDMTLKLEGCAARARAEIDMLTPRTVEHPQQLNLLCGSEWTRQLHLIPLLSSRAGETVYLVFDPDGYEI